jgi:hypothetical protein
MVWPKTGRYGKALLKTEQDEWGEKWSEKYGGYRLWHFYWVLS